MDICHLPLLVLLLLLLLLLELRLFRMVTAPIIRPRSACVRAPPSAPLPRDDTRMR